MAYVVDRAREPLVVIRYEGGVDDSEFRAYLAQYEALVAAGRRYTVIFDARRASVPNAVQRRMQAQFLEARAGDLSRLCLGGAFVIASPLIRGALTAILFLTPLPFEHVVVPTLEDGERWALARLEGHGLLPRTPRTRTASQP
ncbi:MAG: hypothetical protein U0230_13575 [Polyangiales bacterium]